MKDVVPINLKAREMTEVFLKKKLSELTKEEMEKST